MTSDSKVTVDDIGVRLLRALQDNARMSFADLARVVGLSPPAVAERVRRLEELGVIAGYRAVIDRSRLGIGLTAFIRARVPSDQYARIDSLAREMPEILECHHVTGDDGFVFKVWARSVQHLDQIILRLAPFAATASSIVLSTKVENKSIDPRAEAAS